MNGQPSSWSIETSLLGGHAIACGEAFERALEGAAIQIAQVEIPDRIDYAQHSSRHLILAALDDRPFGPACRTDGAPHSGQSLTVAPAGTERRGRVRRRRILGVQVAMEPGFVEDACEQALRPGWKMRQDAPDAKGHRILVFAAEAAREGDGLACETLLTAAARHLGKTYAGASGPRDDGWLHPRALLRVVDRMRAEHGRRLTLSELAREAGLGVSAFSRAFRGSTGKTPVAFARDLRLARARGLLETTDMTVRDIAAASGFSSASHLIRHLRARREQAPGALRRLR